MARILFENNSGLCFTSTKLIIISQMAFFCFNNNQQSMRFQHKLRCPVVFEGTRYSFQLPGKDSDSLNSVFVSALVLSLLISLRLPENWQGTCSVSYLCPLFSQPCVISTCLSLFPNKTNKRQQQYYFFWFVSTFYNKSHASALASSPSSTERVLIELKAWCTAPGLIT